MTMLWLCVIPAALLTWWLLLRDGSLRDDATERWEREVITRGLTRKD